MTRTLIATLVASAVLLVTNVSADLNSDWVNETPVHVPSGDYKNLETDQVVHYDAVTHIITPGPIDPDICLGMPENRIPGAGMCVDIDGVRSGTSTAGFSAYFQAGLVGTNYAFAARVYVDGTLVRRCDWPHVTGSADCPPAIDDGLVFWQWTVSDGGNGICGGTTGTKNLEARGGATNALTTWSGSELTSVFCGS